MSDITIHPATAVQGEVRLPGDKSVSHRALLLAMLGTRPVRIRNIASSDDVQSTLHAVEALGATVERDADDDTVVTVTGVGMEGAPTSGLTIDAGNSGTLARLLPGLLAGQGIEATITGDASLTSRPMARVTGPLNRMGARIESSEQGTLPLVIHASSAQLRGIEYELPMASAQVQTALLFAGLFADGPTTVREPAQVRDHTERMLRRAGVRVKRSGNEVTVEPADSVELGDTDVPTDPSGAAPFIAAASMLHGSLLRVPDLMLNPGRNGFLELLEHMGARISTFSRRSMHGEPVADVEIQAGSLVRTTISPEHVPRMIDELPLLGLVAQFCRGETVIRGAGELRVKETDRITVLVRALRNIGINAEERRDGFVVRGSGTRPPGGTIETEGDHRIAMLGGVAGLVSRQGVTVSGAECVSVSFPGFFEALESVATRG